MVKCSHFQVQYRLNVDNSGRWECLECGQRFQPVNSSTEFIDACAAQQEAIESQSMALRHILRSVGSGIDRAKICDDIIDYLVELKKQNK